MGIRFLTTKIHLGNINRNKTRKLKKLPEKKKQERIRTNSENDRSKSKIKTFRYFSEHRRQP